MISATLRYFSVKYPPTSIADEALAIARCSPHNVFEGVKTLLWLFRESICPTPLPPLTLMDRVLEPFYNSLCSAFYAWAPKFYQMALEDGITSLPFKSNYKQILLLFPTTLGAFGLAIAAGATGATVARVVPEQTPWKKSVVTLATTGSIGFGVVGVLSFLCALGEASNTAIGRSLIGPNRDEVASQCMSEIASVGLMAGALGHVYVVSRRRRPPRRAADEDKASEGT
ncbi:MAG TPA: hypothetical protein VM580_24445 [Labilithrix sp.]|nr:hypothetical protein [Labilithrix sp.]